LSKGSDDLCSSEVKARVWFQRQDAIGLVIGQCSDIQTFFFCSRTPRCNFSSTLYHPKLLVYNSSCTQSVIYIQNNAFSNNIINS
jgi:hypothetical protein